MRSMRSLLKRLSGRFSLFRRIEVEDFGVTSNQLQPVENIGKAKSPNTMAEQEKPFLSPLELPTLEEIFLLIEVDEAEPLVGDLFKRRFHTDTFPDEPRHFVALVMHGENGFLPIGYVHYTMWEGCALCGGLVIDDRRYRRLTPPIRKVLRDHGGVAELLFRQSFSRLPDDLVAIWGHVGDKQSEKVCLRVGFEETDAQYILAVWRNKRLTDIQKAEWVKRVEALGAF